MNVEYNILLVWAAIQSKKCHWNTNHIMIFPVNLESHKSSQLLRLTVYFQEVTPSFYSTLPKSIWTCLRLKKHLQQFLPMCIVLFVLYTDSSIRSVNKTVGNLSHSWLSLLNCLSIINCSTCSDSGQLETQKISRSQTPIKIVGISI